MAIAKKRGGSMKDFMEEVQKMADGESCSVTHGLDGVWEMWVGGTKARDEDGDKCLAKLKKELSNKER
jgi:hypothetical protein